jgi:alpha-D-xyloside xylohydrolase
VALLAVVAILKGMKMLFSVRAKLPSLIFFLVALPLIIVSAGVARGDESIPQSPQIQVIAPGIWRLRFGTPELFTPTHFRSANANTTALAKMASATNLPLDLGKLVFRASDQGCYLSLPMERRENIYGLGLMTELFDLTQVAGAQAGRRIFLQPTDSPENELGESHAPAPFYVSSQGYGVFVDTARFASFYTGDDAPVSDHADAEAGGAETSTTELYRAREKRVKTMLVQVPAAKGLDVYIFAGPTMLQAVERYNLFSGGGPVPPLWGLGVQYRGYTKYGARDTLDLAARLRADHIPCDVWGVEPGWQSRVYSCSFVWNSNQFPDPDGFLKKMAQMNYRMSFWEHAFTHPDSPIYNALKPYSGDFLVWNGLVPDFASAEGRKIFLSQNRIALFDRGVESVKLDECDYQPDSFKPWSFPTCSIFPSGLDGELMHSLFGLLYQQTMAEPYTEKGLRTWGLVRNSHALGASLPYCIYSDSYDHRCYVRGIANQGFSGLLWSPELRDAKSIEDMYRRLETTLFSPDTVINAWYIKNPPWYQVSRGKNNKDEFMPERQAMTDGVRKLLQLRMQFIPYLYSAFNEYHNSGKPPIRALVLDWPKDPKVREIDDQFMFGDSILVAPIFAGETSRQVYLPKGEWHDFWTHEKIAGAQTITATNSWQEIPLYVKGGTLLPLAEPVEFIQPGTCFKITVNIVGNKTSDFTLDEDDGVSSAFLKGNQNKMLLHADGDTHSATRTGSYHGPDRYQIVDWKQF